ncbi:hypothetical protein GY31_06055 [Lysinibacillus sphaericus]|nr:hypothetical protein GY31_06055 [Lysinibacillus sphaericus]
MIRKKLCVVLIPKEKIPAVLEKFMFAMKEQKDNKLFVHSELYIYYFRANFTKKCRIYRFKLYATNVYIWKGDTLKQAVFLKEFEQTKKLINGKLFAFYLKMSRCSVNTKTLVILGFQKINKKSSHIWLRSKCKLD